MVGFCDVGLSIPTSEVHQHREPLPLKLSEYGMVPFSGYFPNSVPPPPERSRALELSSPEKQTVVCTPEVSLYQYPIDSNNFNPEYSNVVSDGVANQATGNKPYECAVCMKTFQQRNTYQNHLRSHNKEGEDPYHCDICGKSFAVPARLTRHYRTHTGEKPYQCEFCNKSFSVKENLSVHRRIHTKERPYKCEVCERAFEHSGKLHRHMRIHTGERPHKCSVCNKTFIQSGQLVIHMRTHTGEKPYVCKVCKKGFTCSKQLKVHTRTHTGEKPYTCEICGKSFGYNHVLKLHQVAHYGEKVYKCTICNSTFNSKKLMEAHIKSHSESPAPPLMISSAYHPQSDASSSSSLSDKENKFGTESDTESPPPITISVSSPPVSIEPDSRRPIHHSPASPLPPPSPQVLDLKMDKSSYTTKPTPTLYRYYLPPPQHSQYIHPHQQYISSALSLAPSLHYQQRHEQVHSPHNLQTSPRPPPIEFAQRRPLTPPPLAVSPSLHEPAVTLLALALTKPRQPIKQIDHVISPPSTPPCRPTSSLSPSSSPASTASTEDRETLILPPRKRSKMILERMALDSEEEEIQSKSPPPMMRYSSVIHYAERTPSH